MPATLRTLRPITLAILTQVVVPPPRRRRQIVGERRRAITGDLVSRLHRPANVDPALARHKRPKTSMTSAHLRAPQLSLPNNPQGSSTVICTVKCV